MHELNLDVATGFERKLIDQRKTPTPGYWFTNFVFFSVSNIIDVVTRTSETILE